MEQTPKALRRHVVLLGSTNAGKSTLFNALTGQDGSIVSAVPGTTTDPVSKAMELIPFGPIVLVDTAGLGDASALGEARVRKTRAAKRRADAALYVAEAADFDSAAYDAFCREGIDHLLVFTKCDLLGEAGEDALRRHYPAALFLTPDRGVGEVHRQLSALLARRQPDEEASLVGDLIPPGGTAVLVCPIDSEAPRGRLILPQVQVLRDCLDHGIQATVCREFELEAALANLNRVDLVVTDSQAFGYVSERVPQEIPLTSFSMLLARQKGDFHQLLGGADALDTLPDGGRVLVLEGCTHNHTHEDIGRVKIPALLKKRTGKELTFHYSTGYDFPDDLSPYDMAVQCGCCMISRREITTRLRLMKEAGLPVTNYGILLAWGTGTLDRCCRIFREVSA